MSYLDNHAPFKDEAPGNLWRKHAPVLGMLVLLAINGKGIKARGKIVRLREPLGLADVQLDSGEIRYCITNDPYSDRAYWVKC